jgi:tetratricopeptide (TPR) repeat protein
MGADIYLMQKGSYAIHDLLAARKKMSSGGVGAALSAKLNTLMNAPTANQSTVAGVRGADESKSTDSDWVENSAQESIRQAKDEIQSGRYFAAIQRLTASLDEATADELPELRYTLAYAYSQSDDTQNAAQELAGAQPSDGTAWAGDYILLQAKLYLDTFAFDQAVQWLSQGKHDLSRDAQRATIYYFLLGMGYRGLGNTANEKQVFTKLVAMDGQSELGKSAAQLLKGTSNNRSHDNHIVNV